MIASQVIVIGIGNTDAGDDAAGLIAARHLRGILPAEIDVVEEIREVSSLLMRLEGVAAAFFIDACRSGSPSGTVHRFDVALAPLPSIGFGLTTHDLALAEILELARTLGKLPAQCVVYAVEGQSFEVGAPLAPPVRAAVIALCETLRSEITSASEKSNRGF